MSDVIKSDQPIVPNPTPPILDPDVIRIANAISSVLGVFRFGTGFIGKFLGLADRWIGWIAFALIVFGQQGGCHIHIPHIPWPWPDPLPGPSPVDQFSKSLQEAYTAEVDPTKAKQVAYTATVFRQEVPMILSQPDVSTITALFAKISPKLHDQPEGFPRGSLPKVFGVIGGRLNVSLGTGPTSIDPQLKQKCISEFSVIATDLEKLK